jgi:sulfatase maturation enzyme AslB (radical SAM superfamily)
MNKKIIPIKQIPLQEYIRSTPKPAKKPDDTAMCSTKWTSTWVSLSRGIIKSCCQVPDKLVTDEDIKKYDIDVFQNHPYDLERRKEKLENIRHVDCKLCWDLEDKKIHSPRLSKPFYDLHKQRFDLAEDSVQPLTTQLELYFNNTCDLKCIYCNSDYSTQLETEDLKFGKIKKHKTDHTLLHDTFWKWLEEDAADKLLQYFILGGEPLIQPEFYNFIDRLLVILKSKPNRFGIKPELIITSNGNTPPSYLEKWFNKIAEIDPYLTVQINISIEGTGPKAEYIRTNLDWERFSSNLDKTVAICKKFNLRNRLSISHSVLSITSFLDLLKWVKSLEDKHNTSIELIQTHVNHPYHLSPLMLTQEFSSYVDEVCNWINEQAPDWASYADFMKGIAKNFGTQDPKLNRKFIEWEQEIYKRRNLKFLDIFPEMTDWYNKLQ